MPPKRALTGIQPSGVPHVGNLKGMIEPAIQLQDTTEPYYFIASFHALTTTHDAEILRKNQREAALTFLAFGLDPARAALFRQEDVPEVDRARLDPRLLREHGRPGSGPRREGRPGRGP
jgi:tryptophanyl-tRNA synthetase